MLHLECPLNVHYGVLWRPAIGNSTISIPCSKIHASFSKRLYIIRRCSVNGTWMAADLSSCTVHADMTGLLILSFLCSNISTAGSDIENQVLNYSQPVTYFPGASSSLIHSCTRRLLFKTMCFIKHVFMTLQVEEMLNKLKLSHDSINTAIYPNDHAVIIRVKLYSNISYTIDNTSVIYSTILESPDITDCHIISDSLYSAVYLPNGSFLY